ncbi:TetR family transcriptional regulator [Microbacterium radiodurans]|uniref:TetR family transcriptional regulator n=1 Tax=Microbacterium radiodurans TaxID=661398 RepID=A0A5J5ITG9_9MICO|nr:TetR family transcriptional regulator [Microbacterium radiodurans]KAA9089168.1 TetR family transcriptional regulator [Microbacterium radiodurans]
MRSDLKRNKLALLEAAGEIVRADPGALTMQAVAARAGVAASTAWRHFSGLEDLMHAFAYQQAADLRGFADRADGSPSFMDTVAEWVRIVLRSGPALVHFRSRRGFLERTAASDDILVVADEAWRPALGELLRSCGLGDDALPTAKFLANSVLDPREILDLHQHARMDVDHIVVHLSGAVGGALRGWAASGAPHIGHG